MIIISVFILPVLILLGLYAESFVIYLLGESWIEAIWPLRILVIFGLLRSYLSVCGFIFWSIGEPNIQTKILFVQLIILAILIIPLTINFGITGTAISVTSALMISFFMHFYSAFKKLNIEFKDLKLYFSSILIGSITLLVLIALFEFFQFQINSALVFIIYFIALLVFFIMISLVSDFLGSGKILNLWKNTSNYIRARNDKHDP